jgi:hypothetical protein
MVPSRIFTEEKDKKFSVHGQSHGTAFRDCGAVILGDAMPKGETVNPDAYIWTLK